MPELPEVETIARELAPLVVGRTITGFRTDWPRAIRHPAPERFAAGVAGREVLDVDRRAKWLVLSLSGASGGSGEGASPAVLAIQVKMTGQLTVVTPDEPADKHVHHFFELSDGRELRIRDTRKFGRLGLYRRDEAGAILGSDEARELFADFGPEPLDPAFTVRRFNRLVRARRGRLKTLLLNQGFLAGIGNIYADEALWRAQLHPLRSAQGLNADQRRRLYHAIREVLREAIERRGSSVDSYRSVEGEGEMQHHLNVYGRTGMACPRCGRPTRRIVVNARSTHFCSWCQRLPAAERAGAVRELLAAARGSAGEGRTTRARRTPGVRG